MNNNSQSLFINSEHDDWKIFECRVDCQICTSRTTKLFIKNGVPVLIFCYTCTNSYIIREHDTSKLNIDVFNI